MWNGGFKRCAQRKKQLKLNIDVSTETSETFDDEHCAEANGSYDLADIITVWRTLSSLSCIEKNGYLIKTLLSVGARNVV